MTHIRDGVLSYCEQIYASAPEYPWARFPSYAVLRHEPGRKWFAAILEVPREVLGLDGDGTVDILNLKCDPDEIGGLRMQPGFLPGYHMNKEHWITILLDGTVALPEIERLIDQSHRLTAHG